MTRKPSTRPAFGAMDAGWFFVTVNTRRRHPSLGRIRGDEFEPTYFGCLVLDCWRHVLDSHDTVTCEVLQGMPEHLHVVLGLAGGGSTLQQIISSAKAMSTRRGHRYGLIGARVKPWQRSYHAVPLVDEEAVARAVAYALDNPAARARRRRGER